MLCKCGKDSGKRKQCSKCRKADYRKRKANVSPKTGNVPKSVSPSDKSSPVVPVLADKDKVNSKTWMNNGEMSRLYTNRDDSDVSPKAPSGLMPTEIMASLDHYNDNPALYVRRLEPDKLNWGKWMDSTQLELNKLKANRVSIPGDWDYQDKNKTSVLKGGAYD